VFHGQIYQSDLSDERCWIIDTNKVSKNKSYVETFDNPAISTKVLSFGCQTCIVAYETTNTNEIDVILDNDKFLRLDSLCSTLVNYNVDYQIVAINSQEQYQHCVHIYVGHYNIAPLYLTSNNQCLTFSWDISRILYKVRRKDINIAKIVSLLTGYVVYNEETIFKDVFTIPERFSVYWDGLTIKFNKPQHAQRVRPQQLKSTNEELVISYYKKILQNTIISKYSDNHAEFSGGLDSSIVSIVKSHASKYELKTYGIQISSCAKTQQKNRRRQIIRKFLFDDYLIDSDKYPPMDLSGFFLTNSFVNPEQEPYSDMLNQLIKVAVDNGAKTLTTGIGGDELHTLSILEKSKLNDLIFEFNMLMPSEYTQHTQSVFKEEISSQVNKSIRSTLPESCHQAFACRSPVFLRNGLWPISPLSDLNIQRFSQRLPIEWRLDKTLHKKVLMSFNFSESFISPPLRENFAENMKAGLSTTKPKIIENYLKKSILEELGLINAKPIIKNYNSYIEGKELLTISQLYSVLILEVALNKYLS